MIPNSEPRVDAGTRVSGLEYYAAHHNGKFYIVNNDGAKNFKLSMAPVERPAKENWVDVISSPRGRIARRRVGVPTSHRVARAHRRAAADPHLQPGRHVTDSRLTQFPEPAYSVELENNPEFDTRLLRITYSSLHHAQPRSSIST
jgi:oligopeptidase B